MQEAWTLVQARVNVKRNYTRVPFQEIKITSSNTPIQRHRQGTTNQAESITVHEQQYVCHTKPRTGEEQRWLTTSKNPGRRSLAKMMLNTMWGKFGQRSNKTQVLEYGTDVSLIGVDVSLSFLTGILQPLYR